MKSRIRAGCLGAGLAGAAGLAGCTPPWWQFSTVEVDGRLLADGRCEVTVRGDVARRLGLHASSGMMVGGNAPPPLPEVFLMVLCSAADPSADASDFFLSIPVADTLRQVRMGAYRVLADNAPPAALAAPGTATFLARVYPDPVRRRTEWRDYRAIDGVLTLTSIAPAAGGFRSNVRATGTFHVRARRYFKFD